jgi:hypothetical protein
MEEVGRGMVQGKSAAFAKDLNATRHQLGWLVTCPHIRRVIGKLMSL